MPIRNNLPLIFKFIQNYPHLPLKLITLILSINTHQILLNYLMFLYNFALYFLNHLRKLFLLFITVFIFITTVKLSSNLRFLKHQQYHSLYLLINTFSINMKLRIIIIINIIVKNQPFVKIRLTLVHTP